MNRRLWRSLGWFFTVATIASFVLTARGQSPADDEQTLRSAGLSSDGPALLAIVRKHTLTPEARRKVLGLIVQLGDEQFAAREAATKELFALGRIALPLLRESVKSTDLEVARRAKRLIERIEQEPAHRLPVAVLRLIGVCKPPGAIAALLAYLPHAEEDNLAEEVRKSLTALAKRDGKADPDLLRALADAHAPTIRFHVALALAVAQDRAAIPVLIDLLAVLPFDRVGEVESVLLQLAEDTAPKVSIGEKPEERAKGRAAWAAWWKINCARADLKCLIEPRMLGYTLICDINRDRVYEIDRHGKKRWTIDNVRSPSDAWVLPGDRVLIAEWSPHRVTERDFKGKVLWEKPLPSYPTNVQRLPNGNTFIAMLDGPIMEIDRAGKAVYTIETAADGVIAAYRSRGGSIVCLKCTGECIHMNADGKQLRSFTDEHADMNAGCLEPSPNGRILITQRSRNKVVEYDSTGKILLEADAPKVTTASALPNGHILVASGDTQRVYELDRTGKVVWEYKNAGGAFRARRR